LPPSASSVGAHDIDVHVPARIGLEGDEVSVGDQAGETFVALPLVGARCPVPSAFMT
jgi:hypothetical protein